MLENDIQAKTALREQGVSMDADAEKNNVEILPNEKSESAENTGNFDNSRQINSENARRRRENERKEELKKARDEAIIFALEGKNPISGKPLKSGEDVKEYLEMRRQNDTNYQIEKESEMWFENDRNNFVSMHPEVDIDKLINDKKFQVFADGKVGEMPLSEIYDKFTDFMSEIGYESRNMAFKSLANKMSSPGSLSRNAENSREYFTKDEVKNMSPSEVHINYEKIRKSMTKWK